MRQVVISTFFHISLRSVRQRILQEKVYKFTSSNFSQFSDIFIDLLPVVYHLGVVQFTRLVLETTLTLNESGREIL